MDMRNKVKVVFIIILFFCSIGLTSCLENEEKEPVLVYMAHSQNEEKTYEIKLFKDIGKEQNEWKLQSVGLDKNQENLFKLDGSKRVLVYDFATRQYKSERVKPKETGHDNDLCIIEDTMYIVGSKITTYLRETQKLYRWSLEDDKIERLEIKGIEPAEGISIRCLMGVCSYSENELVLVTQDYLPDVPAKETFNVKHESTDKLCVYRYNLETKQAEKVFEKQWDAVFIQGATLIGDQLFVACNIQTDRANNYKGVEIQIIDLNEKKEIDKIIIPGIFEAEGLFSYSQDEETYLLFGLARPGRIAQIVTMKI